MGDRGDLFCQDADATLKRINTLIDAAENAGAPLVFVRHIHSLDGSDLGRMFDYAGPADDFNFKEGTTQVEYSQELRLPPRRLELVKHRYSAFVGTALDALLRRENVTRVVICGFMTNFCCESTARDAHDRDYFVDFGTDGTGTPGTDKLNEKAIREVVGELLAAGFARVLTTEDEVAELRTSSKD